jgi:hypothetical protein
MALTARLKPCPFTMHRKMQFSAACNAQNMLNVELIFVENEHSGGDGGGPETALVADG